MTTNPQTTPNQPLLFNLMILDQSGSMSSMTDPVRHVFHGHLRSLVDEQNRLQDLQQFMQLWTFGGSTIHEAIPLMPVKAWDQSYPSYHPDGSTPLLDALGTALNALEGHISRQDLASDQYKVQVFIITDGEENSSKEYDGPGIARKIRKLTAAGWTFDYFGTDHDIDKIADELSIKNRKTFDKNAEGLFSVTDEYRKEKAIEKEKFMSSFKK